VPRTSQGPRYYASKHGWFGNFDGERIRLTTGPKKQTEQEAKEKYQAEREARKVEEAGDRNLVWAVLNAYLSECENRVKTEDMAANTLNLHRFVLTPFSERCGQIVVREFRTQHLTDFLAEMRKPRWHPTLKRMVSWDGTTKTARNVIKRVFRWAVEEAGLISRSPLDRTGRGKKEKRKRRRPPKTRVAILDSEYQMLLEQANRRSKKDFYNLLQFLHRTGARPAEMYLAKASEWDEKRHAFVVKGVPQNRGRFKLAYLGEDRTIYIPDDLVPLARELMTQYPDGPIFRTESGMPWKNNTLCARFRSIKKAANRAASERGVPPVRKGVTAYSLRHAYVTRWIEQDRPIWKLCELLNTSEQMLRQHYSHLFERTESLREALNDFDRGSGEQPAISTGHGLASEPALAS
jgi:site-specific recombinase XerD